MDVLLASIIRNGESYLDRYIAQARGLRTTLRAAGHELIPVCCEGDSTDHSAQILDDLPDWIVFHYSHGGPVFGSINAAERWRNIARTWNYLFDQVEKWEFDALLYVEADLVWKPETMLALLADLQSPEVDIVAPMSFAQGDVRFYDTWGYRSGGVNFTSSPPYHQIFLAGKLGLLPLESAGSCQLMTGEVARACRFSEQDAMIGPGAVAKGFRFWLNPNVSVEHPAEGQDAFTRYLRMAVA